MPWGLRYGVVSYPAHKDQAPYSGDSGGVALDVFDEEPLPAASRLRSFDQAVLSPHIAGNRNS